MPDAIKLPADLVAKINQAMIVRPGDMLVLVVDHEMTEQEHEVMRAELRAGIGDSQIRVLVVHGARAFVAEGGASATDVTGINKPAHSEYLPAGYHKHGLQGCAGACEPTGQTADEHAQDHIA